MTQRKVVFVRHKLDRDVVEDLWERQQIAVRFRDTPSIHPDGYKRRFAQQAIARLRNYCSEGVIVGASYRSYQPSKLLIGTFGPGDPDFLIKPVQLNNYYHKIVQLENVKIFSYRDYPILDIQPTHQTICRWRMVGKHARAIYYGQPLDWSIEALTPSQLEVLCYEYLRMAGEIDVLLLPIGRSLPDIDIYGLRATGDKVIAQVTHQSSSSKIGKKRQRLCEYAGAGVHLIFFGPKKRQFEDRAIRYIATEDVFEYVAQADSESVHTQMLKHMLRR